MKNWLLITLFCLATTAVYGAEPPLSSTPSHPEHLTVHLQSGETLTAPVDPRTNAEKLWLRFEGRSVKLLRPVAWSAIASAQYRGAEVPLAALPVLARELISARSIVDDITSRAPATKTHSDSAHQILFTPAVPEIHALKVSARASGSAAAKDDGLWLSVTALNSQGAPVATAMELVVTLDATKDFYRPNWDGGFQHACRWTLSLTNSQLKNGSPARLTFPAGHENWGTVGRLTVRAVIPGQGEWERQTLVRWGSPLVGA